MCDILCHNIITTTIDYDIDTYGMGLPLLYTIVMQMSGHNSCFEVYNHNYNNNNNNDSNNYPNSDINILIITYNYTTNIYILLAKSRVTIIQQ